MPSKPIIVWFRNDLRLADNRALSAAVAAGAPVLPVYIYDPQSAGRWAPGAASRWWLHHSLTALADTLSEHDAPLILRRGRAGDILAELVAEIGAGAIYFSRAYEPWARAEEDRVKQRFATGDVEIKRYAGALLREPEDVRTKSGEPFKVYTPFWR
jgi:deoxyribodipyrimidine photo-lyase